MKCNNRDRWAMDHGGSRQPEIARHQTLVCYLMTLLIFVLLTLQLSFSFAQDYSVPSQWANTSSSLNRNDRIQLAQDVLETLAPMYDSTYGTIDNLNIYENAELFTAVAMHDSLTSSTSNYSTSRDRLSRVLYSPPRVFDAQSGQKLWWSIGAIYAYNAYTDLSFLSDAISIWEEHRQFVISPSDAANGRYPMLNITFPSTCNGASNAGGVLESWYPQPSYLIVDTISTGSYMGLSAYLFAITDNKTYHDAAQLSMMFIQSHLYNDATTNYVESIFYPVTCQLEPNSDTSTVNSGLYLEALSVFAYKTNNDTLIHQADQLALNAMEFSPWNSRNGVVHEASGGPGSVRGVLMRALYGHWTRSAQDSEISKLIKAFLIVQHNNLQNNVRYPGTSTYTSDWKGPPQPSIDLRGQSNALGVLNFAIDLGDSSSSISVPTSSSSTTGPTNTPSATSTPVKHSPSLGPIIGGSIGGFLFVIIVIILSVVFHRRKARNTRSGVQYAVGVHGEGSVVISGGNQDQRPFVEPFPPPFPSITDLSHSSKLRNEVQHLPNMIAQDSLLPPPSASRELQDEHSTYLVPGYSAPSSAPPEYQTVIE
ncbi:hypothetical protein QCA50_008136 [Cerrena zonata]|uniref:Glycoside hydrolase family 76 protein n=1 Tax=Cerrena zonata TaxID=2478898 RepID=A0AAW0G4J5_9APHY